MISAKRLATTRSRSEGRTFLKYQDIPFGTRIVRVRVLDVRESPKLNSPALLDIDRMIECDGKQLAIEKTSIPVNFTNLAKLATLLDNDDITAARGMVLSLGFSMKNNPNARSHEDEEVMGIDFIAIALPETMPEQNEAPEPKPAAVAPAPAVRKKGAA